MEYVCDQCGYSQDTPGTCPDCGVDLKEKTQEGESLEEENTGDETGEESEEETW